jgi:hypothetical protein
MVVQKLFAQEPFFFASFKLQIATCSSFGLQKEIEQAMECSSEAFQ